MESMSCDVLVVGGGMVGAAIAAVLGQTGFEVIVLEKHLPAPFDAQSAHDLRVSALSLSSQGVLEAVGAWPRLAAMRICPFRRMRVWDQGGRGETNFDAALLGEPVLGHIVENRLVQQALLDVLRELDTVRVIEGAVPERLEVGAEQAIVHLTDGRRLRARLVVGADGAGSRLRELAGLGMSARDYDMHAFVASVRTAQGQQDITWQRFTPQGPQALLPLGGPHASLVWYDTPATVARLEQLDDEALIDTFERHFPSELGRIEAIERRGHFALRRMHVHDYVAPRVALAGDAAHTIHPLAGQGVNLGFLDAAALAEVIHTARTEGRDIGSMRVLRRYERWRKADNHLMQTGMDVFHHVFRPQNLPLRLVRNLGLTLAERLKPIKALSLRHATGRRPFLPRLAYGLALESLEWRGAPCLE
ncbi:MAG: UbiH/UbiF/VisC/COQ6 family ubiquinone biosynthesis hydroxylase [Pseudomonadota bacterium]